MTTEGLRVGHGPGGPVPGFKGLPPATTDPRAMGYPHAIEYLVRAGAKWGSGAWYATQVSHGAARSLSSSWHHAHKTGSGARATPGPGSRLEGGVEPRPQPGHRMYQERNPDGPSPLLKKKKAQCPKFVKNPSISRKAMVDYQAPGARTIPKPN